MDPGAAWPSPVSHTISKLKGKCPGDWQPHPGLQGRGAYQTLLSEKGSVNEPSLSRWKFVRGNAGPVRAPGDPSTNPTATFRQQGEGEPPLLGHAPPPPPPDTATHPPDGSVGVAAPARAPGDPSLSLPGSSVRRAVPWSIKPSNVGTRAVVTGKKSIKINYI